MREGYSTRSVCVFSLFWHFAPLLAENLTFFIQYSPRTLCQMMFDRVKI